MIAFVVSAVLSQVGGATPQEATDNAELTRLERVWNEAHLQGDAHALDGLWDQELVVTVPGMPVLTRADAIAMARSGKMRFERYETSGLRIRVYGDAGLVTGRLQRRRAVDGRVMDDDWQFTKVYVRRGGQWKVVAFHASEAPR
jgi:hypothetical protein